MRVLLILFTLFVAAWSQQTIISYLTARRYTQFINYVQQAGLTSTLSGTDNYTVFAPSNSAFYRLDPAIRNDNAKLTEFIKFHVVSGIHRYKDININEYQLASLQGSNIRINHYYSNGVVTAEGQRFYSGEHLVSNGNIFLLNGVMMPPTGTIIDIISNDGNLTTLRNAITAAGLENFFQDQSPITLFAPTDKAFSYFGATKLQALTNNPTLLASVLKYHVIPGTLYAAGYHADYMHTFEETDRLRLSRYLSGYEAEGGQIDNAQLSATNGVVHRINELLIPSSLAAQIQALR